MDALALWSAWDDGEYRRLVDWLRSPDPSVVVVFDYGDSYPRHRWITSIFYAFYQALRSRYTILPGSRLLTFEELAGDTDVIIASPGSKCSQNVNAIMRIIQNKDKQWSTPLMVFTNVHDSETPLDIYSENINLSLTTVVTNVSLQYRDSLAAELVSIIRGSGGLTKSAAPRHR